MGCVNSGFLELVIRPAGVNRFMLANVAHEQYAVVRTEAPQKRVYLLRARQARFVEHVESLLISCVCLLIAARQVPLQRAGLDPGLGQFCGPRVTSAQSPRRDSPRAQPRPEP